MLHGAGTIGGVDGICFFSLMHRAYFTSSYYGFRLSGMVDTVEEFTLLLTHGSQRMDPEESRHYTWPQQRQRPIRRYL